MVLSYSIHVNNNNKDGVPSISCIKMSMCHEFDLLWVSVASFYWMLRTTPLVTQLRVTKTFRHTCFSQVSQWGSFMPPVQRTKGNVHLNYRASIPGQHEQQTLSILSNSLSLFLILFLFLFSYSFFTQLFFTLRIEDASCWNLYHD
jgi:hypothetical protein